MKFAHIKAKLTSSPWLATPSVMESIVSLINSRMSGAAQAIFDSEDDDDEEKRKKPMSQIIDGVAVIDVSGVIGKRLSAMETACWGVDVDAVRAEFDAANTDGNVKGILLHMDSPGGSVTGVPELAAHIASTKSKPLVAYTDTLCCSGGYYLASGADAIYASETAMVGSIGAIVQIVDQSSALERVGIKVHTFKSGEMKDLGNPNRPMTDEEKAHVQSGIDAIGARFRADVLASRPLVKPEGMNAGVFDGAESLSLGLIDGIANTRAEVLNLFTAT